MQQRSNKRPVSPNLQIYRPQLTSVLSFANRLTGIALSLALVVLVIWLIGAASGPAAFARIQGWLGSWLGLLLLFGMTFAFFLHLCGGIRHLIWDTVRGFELGQIYASGWLVVAASLALTAITWIAALLIGLG